MGFMFGPVLLIFCAAMWILLRAKERGHRQQEAQGAIPCPHCGYDLRGGNELCPECGRKAPREDEEEDGGVLFNDLLLTTPLEPRTPAPEEKLIAACTTSSSIEANFLMHVLENRGITSLMEGAPRPTDYQPAKMRLMVWSADAEAAEALIAEIRRRQMDRRGIDPE